LKRAAFRAVHFWFGMGVDGLRLDAVPYLFERDGTTCENLPETHAFLRRIRREMDAGYTDRVLLAEANDQSHRVIEYFGDSDECHMAFHFPLMPKLFLGMFRQHAKPIVDAVEATACIPDGCQWATFLRNHDELTLSAVSDDEREFLLAACLAEPHMRLHRGIRRRLAPLLGNDRRRIELAYALLLALPGTPVLYYGDEIGMGDDLRLRDRDGVRTPMQWSDDANAGFAPASAPALVLPLIDNPVNGYRVINVAAQQHRESLLAGVRRLIRARRRHRAFGRGDITFLSTGVDCVLAFLRRHDDDVVLVVANLSDSVRSVTLDTMPAMRGTRCVEIVDDVEFPAPSGAPYTLTLAPYGFYWLSDAEAPYDSHVSDARAATPFFV
ncbi:MAG: alpha-glucosidase C-terminal domain-containing protein, partial [Gemmatimonadaceae bacterium]